MVGLLYPMVENLQVIVGFLQVMVGLLYPMVENLQAMVGLLYPMVENLRALMIENSHFHCKLGSLFSKNRDKIIF